MTNQSAAAMLLQRHRPQPRGMVAKSSSSDAKEKEARSYAGLLTSGCQTCRTSFRRSWEFSRSKRWTWWKLWVHAESFKIGRTTLLCEGMRPQSKPLRTSLRKMPKWAPRSSSSARRGCVSRVLPLITASGSDEACGRLC
jgi:hypothetical protein